MTQTIKIASINIRGNRSLDRRRLLLNICLEGNFDLIGLQEVTFSECSCLESHYNLISNLGPHKLGTAVLVRRGIPVSRELLDPDGRLISVDVGSFSFMTVYAPSGRGAAEDRNDFLRRTIPAYASTSKLPLILVGDFNCVDELRDRTTQPNAQTRPSRLINLPLTEMTSGLELVDIWKKLKPSESGHTFFYPNGSSRIDRIYSSRDVADNITNVNLKPVSFSDHFSLECTLTCNSLPPRIPKQHSLWKLNTTILVEEAFQLKIVDFINSCSKHPLRERSVADWWENHFKPGIKRIAISYSRQRAQTIRETKLFYQTCIKELVNSDNFDWEEFRELRSLSKSWEENILHGFGVRSRIFEGSETEKATVYHIKRARQNGRNSNITKLTSSNGDTLSSSQDVNDEIVNYFKSIFKERPLPDQQYENIFLDGVKSCLPNCQTLTEPFTSTEIKTALLATKRNKSPGTDGIPNEFYIFFWDLIAPHFLDMFNHVLERDSISQSQGRAAVRLIPKSSGLCGVSGYRPISLLNTDYKLMASVLANRLKRTLSQTVKDFQKGGVPGRLLADNLCLYRDVIQYVDERTNQEQHLDPPGSKFGAAIIGVDLAKAYDLVNRDVLWRIMGAMGYPQSFIRWLNTMYSVADMTILNGPGVAGTIYGVQSVRQGCPLSMHLFVIYIEPMLVRISQTLQGIKFFDKRISVRAMVDDVAIFVSSDSDIIKAGEVLDQFCCWTKAMMNKQKTKALGLGSWRRRTDWPLPWLKSELNLSLLGIKFSSSIEETTTRLWDSSFGHMLGILRESTPRRFTVYQKVNFIKTKVLSRSVYIAQILPCPDKVSLKILNALVKYVWLGHLEKPQRSATFRPPKQGGLGLPNPKMFFKSLFLRPTYNTLISPDSPESSLLRFWMAFPLRKHITNIYNGNSTPVAVIERPNYLKEAVDQIRALIDTNIISPGTKMVHRIIYHHWISGIYGPGKTEIIYPNLDWNFIWKQTAALNNTNVKETMFLFNQRLLPTRVRCHRLDARTDPTCEFCQQDPESDEHLMLHCPRRIDTRTWLERTLHDLGCRTPPMEFIHGHLGPTNNPRTSFTLVAAYIFATWKERRKRKPPTIAEVESIWATIKPTQASPSNH